MIIGSFAGDSLTQQRVYPDSTQIFCCSPTIYNEGVGGWTLPTIDALFSRATDHSPDFIVIQGGTNDMLQASPNAAMQTAVISMCGKSIAAGATPILVEITPLGNSNNWNATKQGYLDTHNTWLASYATTNGYKLALTYSALEDGSNPDDLLPAYNSGDGVHLSEEGYKVMGRAVSVAVQAAGPW